MTQQRAYKRSWKNLLINKRYQLRFTLFMAGLAAVLMTALGWWVIRVADEATTVAKSRSRGTVCPPTAEQAAAAGALAPTSAKPDAAPEPSAAPRRPVDLDESSMTLTEEAAPPPPHVAPPPMSAEERARMNAAHEACEAGISRKLEDIEGNRRMIVLVLVISGVLLTLGLAAFGIKMTHKVAGPLHKVTLYLGKLRDGRYDKVYDLRKGDQLIEFYEHFKHAHTGVVGMERADIARIKAALEAAVADGVTERSADARAATEALRAVLARKEASFV